jgi:putative phage-type endonuclease
MTEQEREEWLKTRIGFISASKMEAVMSKGEGKTRRKYMLQLIAERTTGISSESFQSQAMLDGIENEKFAVAWYESKTGILTDDSTFVKHPTIPIYGASPDRFIGTDGLLEVKCPLRETYLDYIQTGKIDRGYYLQMQTQLDCTGRKYVDFLVFSTAYNNGKIVRVERDEKCIEEIRTEVERLNNDIIEYIESHKEYITIGA